MTRRTKGGWDSHFGAVVENALSVARRHPFAVALIAAGAGWLAHGMSQKRARNSSWHRWMDEADKIPVLNTGQARIYDPDASPRHPTQDLLESRREMSARI